LLSKRTPAAAVQGFSIYRDRFRNDANRNESSALFPINGLPGDLLEADFGLTSAALGA
jgi:hypothetical protein